MKVANARIRPPSLQGFALPMPPPAPAALAKRFTLARFRLATAMIATDIVCMYCQVWTAYRQWGTVGKPRCEEKKKAKWEIALLAVEEHTEA